MLARNKEELAPCPDHVAVFGGGRWARVLTEVLCGIVPEHVRISVHSPHNAKAMSIWVSERGFKQRIDVSSDSPEFSSGKTSAVIVVNAARDHEKAIEWALSAGVPVLVEKPLALNFATSQRLADLACTQKIYLAAAHVFLFARYVENFSKHIVCGDNIKSVRVQWMDPLSESRYGEVKSYDPGLTVYADWLPHVISILGALSIGPIQTCEKVEFLRGGSHLEIGLRAGNIPCNIQLVRNGHCRQRLIEVSTQSNTVALDFSKEPGTIISDSTIQSSDIDWDIKPKPVSRMLSAFLKGAAGGIRDHRLDIAIGLRASYFIDQISLLYQSSLSPWLSNKLFRIQDGDDTDLRYALNEIIHLEDPCSSIPSEKKIFYVYQYIKDHAASGLNTDLLFKRPVDFVKLILKQGKLDGFIKTAQLPLALSVTH